MDSTKKPGQKSIESKRTKICSVHDCGRILGSHNKSGLCHHHFQLEHNKKLRIKLKEEHRCLDCGGKVEPIICPHCNGILKFNSRCNKCFEKIKAKYKLKENDKIIQ